MNTAYISIGSNTGDREFNLNASIELLSGYGEVWKRSSIYETSPWGKFDQDDFLNMVVMIYTELDLIPFFHGLQKIENEMGRIKTEKWGPRVIDLDVLYFNDLIFSNEEISVPHLGLHQRRFVLVPLVEVDPDKIHPQIGSNSRELLEVCSDTLEVRLWNS